MRHLPPSTNADYSGSPLSAHFLTLFSVLTIVPGCIHTFVADGGAGTIAGLDLSQNGRVIVALFAWAGATQIAFGLTTLIISVRYRSLVPLMLALAILERGLHALNAWIIQKGAGSGHHPPEHYAVLVGLPLLIGALALSLRDTPALPNAKVVRRPRATDSALRRSGPATARRRPAA